MSSPFDLDRAVEALRVEHDDSPGDDADATRFRIRESLDRARVMRGRLIASLVVCGVLSTGGVSWAYLSGRLEGVWPWLTHVVGGERVVERAKGGKRGGDAGRVASLPLAPELAEPVAPPVEVARELPAPVEVARELPAPVAANAAPPARQSKPRPAVAAAAPVDAPAARSPSAEPLLAAKPAAPALAAAEPSAAVEPSLAAAPDLYRVAHQLHFHGADASAALAAWDAYLASESSGRFAVEARYNRAMALIRLRRYREAHVALDPFARGEVTPAGYRQGEAKQLSQRLERAIFGERSSAPSGAPTVAPASERQAP